MACVRIVESPDLSKLDTEGPTRRGPLVSNAYAGDESFEDRRQVSGRPECLGNLLARDDIPLDAAGASRPFVAALDLDFDGRKPDSSARNLNEQEPTSFGGPQRPNELSVGQMLDPDSQAGRVQGDLDPEPSLGSGECARDRVRPPGAPDRDGRVRHRISAVEVDHATGDGPGLGDQSGRQERGDREGDDQQ